MNEKEINWLNLSNAIVAIIASLWGGLVILVSGIKIFTVLSKFTYYNMNGNFLFETNNSFQLIKWLVLIINGFLIYIIFSLKNENGKKEMKISRLILIFVLSIPSITISGNFNYFSIPLASLIIIISFHFLLSQSSLKKWLNIMLQKQAKITSIIIYIAIIIATVISTQCIMTQLEQSTKKEFLIITYENKNFVLIYQNENYLYLFPVEEKKIEQINILEINNNKLIQINNDYIEMSYKRYDKIIKRNP